MYCNVYPSVSSGIVLRIMHLTTQLLEGTWWRSWLRHCATSREIAGSIDDVFGIFTDIIFPAAIWP